MTPMYTVGGTVDSRHRIYVERAADDQLLKLCQQGDFAYILTSRQMGKSSLMMRTARRLRAEKEYHVATIDLTRLGASSVSEEQWYLGLLEELGEQLGLDTEPLDYWETHTHLGYAHRFSRFIEQVVLQELPGQVIIFVDEIDSTLSLPFSSDDFLRRFDSSTMHVVRTLTSIGLALCSLAWLHRMI